MPTHNWILLSDADKDDDTSCRKNMGKSGNASGRLGSEDRDSRISMGLQEGEFSIWRFLKVVGLKNKGIIENLKKKKKRKEKY